VRWNGLTRLKPALVGASTPGGRRKIDLKNRFDFHVGSYFCREPAAAAEPAIRLGARSASAVQPPPNQQHEGSSASGHQGRLCRQHFEQPTGS